MENERLTLEEMEEKYPDEWLFIVDCEYSENTELLSGVSLSIVLPVLMFMMPRRVTKVVQRYIVQANYRRAWGTYCNGTYLL